jgi:hypothetical protein
MKSKRMLILQAAILLGGMIAMQGCFEETYSTPAYYPGYSSAPVYSYPTYGYYRTPTWNAGREEHDEHEAHEYHAPAQHTDHQDHHDADHRDTDNR